MHTSRKYRLSSCRIFGGFTVPHLRLNSKYSEMFVSSVGSSRQQGDAARQKAAPVYISTDRDAVCNAVSEAVRPIEIGTLIY